jgi:hypothetical protein
MSVDPSRRTLPDSPPHRPQAARRSATAVTGQPQARVPARPAAEPAADAGEMLMHAALPPQTMQARLDSLGGALDAVRGELAGTTSEYNRLAREASTAADGDPVHHRYALARGLRAALVERWTELSMQIKDLQARQAALPRARVQELAAGLRMLAAVQDVQDPGPGGPGTLAHKAAARANRRHLRAGTRNWPPTSTGCAHCCAVARWTRCPRPSRKSCASSRRWTRSASSAA